ncbi:MAG: hypothetical protein Tsb009_28760 [Planctomycetaceae bacterium]
MTVFTFGFCLWFFGTESPTEVISPGPLAKPHRNVHHDCSTCHTAAEGDFEHWLHHAFDSSVALKDSRKCLNCHAELGENALGVHGLSPEELKSLTQQAAKNSSSHVPLSLQLGKLTSVSTVIASQTKLSCATCHHEHRGENFDLKTMTNAQCSVCHQTQFRDFNHGHPKFQDFPYQRRTRIYFDHARHMKQYFPEANANGSSNQAFDCKHCHTPDRSNRQMLTRGFDVSCKSCHERQIVDRDFPGMPILQLPELNLTELTKANFSVGAWPQPGKGKRLAQLPPFLQMLLRSDPDYRAAMSVLKTTDLRDLGNPRPEHLKPTSQLAWAIKRLIYDVTREGELALEKRLGKQSANLLPLNPSIVNTIKLAQRMWFPKLNQEMKQYTQGTLKPEANLPVSPAADDVPTVTNSSESGGWSIHSEDLSIRYRPAHHADPFLKHWIDQTMKTAPGNGTSESIKSLVNLLSNPSASGTPGTHGPVASGRCLSCHTVDQLPDVSRRVNWSAKSGASQYRPLTHFSHAPHVKPLGKGKCLDCHRLDDSQSAETHGLFRSEFFSRNRKTQAWTLQTDCLKTRTSGFHSMSQASCAQCHTRQSAGADCLKCHNYHSHGRKK